MDKSSVNMSVIIPCYNCSNNIELLLDTIFKYANPSVELVIINDGSTDDTDMTIKRSITSNSHCDINQVIYRSTANRGAAQARTLGLNEANGDYIFFCDADDSLSEDFFESALNLINEKQPDIIYFGSIQMYQDGSDSTDKISVTEFVDGISGTECLNQLLEAEMYSAAVWTYLFKRRLANFSGSNFTSRKVHEDHMFTIPLLCQAESVCFIRKVVYTQNVVQGSLTQSDKDHQYVLDRYYAFKETKRVVEKYCNPKLSQRYSHWSFSAFLRLVRENVNAFANWAALKSLISIIYGERTLILYMIKQRAQ
jgi:glycosyltransferase involved in cell wall biosynthesis